MMSFDSFEESDLEELPAISMINKPKSTSTNESCLICNKGKVKSEDLHIFIGGDNNSPVDSCNSEYMITFSQNNLNCNCSFEVQKSKTVLIDKTYASKFTFDFNHAETSDLKYDNVMRKHFSEIRKMSSKSILADLSKE